MLTTIILLFTLSAVPNGDGLDSLLTVQRERAGVYAQALFQPLENGDLTPEETEDYRFLLAYMSLSDLGMVTGGELLENVRLARRAREQFAWGEQLTDELYRHFVLPHRVSQEMFVNGWR
ncbi:MAG: hypothetical protein P9M15_02240, partial [Candidatus Electryoneaceae bacterium]|nr:hypothetical protein [Candidatus Electryoneaceae bacterium]